MKNKIKNFAINNIVPIVMVIIIAFAIPVSKMPMGDIFQEVLTRLSRNLFLVLSLLIPVVAGMGLNFGIVLGAMGGQIALVLITDWHVIGLQGLFLAMIIGIPISILLGYFGGTILNRAKGREMITSLMLGLFINGVYQLFLLFGMGKIFPIGNAKILLSRGYGIRNAIDLIGIRMVMDDTFAITVGRYKLPGLTIIMIILVCLFIIFFRKTKLGQDMRAVGQDIEVAKASGIDVDKTRVISIIISTVLASIGQLIYLQNIGTLNTYNSHEQIGMFSIAAVLVGGATAMKASIPNALVGVLLFHTLFIVSPMAGKVLMGSAQIGEYFRVFISYGIIAVALVLHQWKHEKEKAQARKKMLHDQFKIKVGGDE